MKRTLIVLFKVGFWFYFIYNVGVIQEIFSTHDKTPEIPGTLHIVDKSHGIEDRQKFAMMLYTHYEKKVTIAKVKAAHQAYTPFDYFTDLRDMGKFRERNGILEDIPVFSELDGCMRESIGHHGITWNDVPIARDKVYFELTEWNKAHPTPPIHWKAVGMRFLKLYLTMLPMAVLYLLLWMYEQNDHKLFKLKNPISFIFAVLIHPLLMTYIIMVYWEDRGREAIAHIEVRRMKKKIFSLLSEDEIALIKNFATSRFSFKQFRLQLTTTGRVAHHSFALACIVTVVLYCVPRATGAPQNSLQNTGETICLISPHHDFHSHNAQYQTKAHCSPISSIAWCEHIKFVTQYSVTIAKHQFKQFSLSLSNGFPTTTEPIPLQVPFLFYFKNELVTFKQNSNEKIYRACIACKH